MASSKTRENTNKVIIDRLSLYHWGSSKGGWNVCVKNWLVFFPTLWILNFISSLMFSFFLLFSFFPYISILNVSFCFTLFTFHFIIFNVSSSLFFNLFVFSFLLSFLTFYSVIYIFDFIFYFINALFFIKSFQYAI